MLKWAVTGGSRGGHQQTPRRSVSQRRSLATPDTGRTRVRRKSLGSELKATKRKLSICCDKENNVTSTPLPGSQLQMAQSPLRKLDTLKDVSNIPQTPGSVTRNPPQYASTLPTFEIEYSPCSVVPGPILALRGIGIADSYFEKPRYLTNEEVVEMQTKSAKKVIEPKVNDRPAVLEPKTPLSSRSFNMKLFQKPAATSSAFKLPHRKSVTFQNNNNNHGDESLSSSRMGDTTLDRMIDAILESARKERRPPKSKQTLKCRIMSPTYTPADDPASDLTEFWDKSQRVSHHLERLDEESPFPPAQQQQRVVTFQQDLPDPSCRSFNEREVRTPDYLEKSAKRTRPSPDDESTDTSSCCLLKRQRAVRRKRNAISDKNCETHAHTPNDTPKCYGNVSPDSGRNSASDLEESTEDVNFTRRRLWYSPEQLQEQHVPTPT